MAEDPRGQHRLGVLLMVGATVAFSLAGLFTRLVALDAWTLLFWRGVFSGVFLALALLWRRRSGNAPRLALGWHGAAMILFSSCSMILYLNALKHTAVADVAIIYATCPFVTAVLAWLCIGERERWTTLAAAAAAIAGVVVMVGGAASGGHWLGDALALAMTFTASAMVIVLRRYRAAPMLEAACVSSFLTALLVLPWASPAIVSGVQFLELVVFGTVQSGVGLLLMMLGGRLISATETAVIGALDAPLAPLWVWGAFAELPAVSTFVGGGIVMVAIGANALVQRAAPRDAPLHP